MDIRIHQTMLRAGITRTPEFTKKGLASFGVNTGTKCGHNCLYCSTGPMKHSPHFDITKLAFL